MTQNLRLGKNIPINLIPNDTNTNVNFTLPASNINGGFTSNDYNNIASVYIDNDNKYGGYYNYYTATAGEGTNALLSKRSGSTSNSICAKGWELPSKEIYSELINHYDFNSIQSSPANFVRAGYLTQNQNFIYKQPASSQNGYHIGSYFSSSIGGDGGCNHLSAYLFLVHNDYRIDNSGTLLTHSCWNFSSDGHSIRCISS